MLDSGRMREMRLIELIASPQQKTIIGYLPHMGRATVCSLSASPRGLVQHRGTRFGGVSAPAPKRDGLLRRWRGALVTKLLIYDASSGTSGGSCRLMSSVGWL